VCLILLGWRAHPDFPLVIAANRDEFHRRPTAPAGFWPEQPSLLAGRDLQAGGTWMGVTRQGRFAALTNYRAPEHHRSNAPSRGPLVSGFLQSHLPPLAYLQHLAADTTNYNGFNLLLGDGEQAFCYSNVSGEIQALGPGVYGLSNELLDTPWPKVVAAKSDLSRALDALPDDNALFRLLRDDTRYGDDQLPRTGVSIELERMLSAAFIKGQDYGTRSSTVVLQTRHGRVSYDEQTWQPDASPGERRRYVFRLQPGENK